MVSLIIWYAIIVSILAIFIIFTELVSHDVILRYSNGRIKRFFAHPLLSYSIQRCGSALISLFLAVTLTFFLLRIQDMEAIYCYGKFSNKIPQSVQELLCNAKLRNYGVDGDVISQYFYYLYTIIPFPKYLCLTTVAKYVTGEGFQLICTKEGWYVISLGISTVIQQDFAISDMFASRMPWSFWIGICAVIIELGIGYPLGVLMAKHKDHLVDHLGNAYIILVGSIPSLVYYYLLQAIFVQWFRLPDRWSQDSAVTWIPAVLTLGIGGIAGISLWVRRYMIDEFSADYIKFARSKGVPENTILFKHVLRNAAVPLVRSIPVSILYCLLGSYFVEKIYFINGFGYLLVDSIQRNDFPVVQAVVLVSAVISVIASLLGDITTAAVDPRVTFSSKE